MTESFETHRCEAMPEGFSLRRYEPDGRKHQFPEPGARIVYAGES